MRARLTRTALFAAAAAIGSTPVWSQQPRSIVVRVHVVDSAGAPVSGADVSILRGLQQILGNGPTDDRGMRTLVVPREDGDYQATVRRIGYTRGDRFFAAPKSDTIALLLEMRRTPQSLEAVKIAAQQDAKRKSYHIDADEIAASSRPIFDALDILRKLKPDMLLGRSGECALSNVWVNGVRIIDFTPNPMAEARRPSTPPPVRVPKGVRAPNLTPKILAVPVSPWNILATIKPEHIAEITYADCFDTTVPKNGAQAAAFVVLKTGVRFEPGIGSMLDERAAAVASTTTLPDAVPVIRAAPDTVGFRRRILGVFDAATGDPIADVEVIDVATGTTAKTTVTGTVSLVYLAEGAGKVRLHKAGYTDQELEVEIAPGKSIPITAVLVPKI
jgi:hypothetical protein